MLSGSALNMDLRSLGVSPTRKGKFLEGCFDSAFDGLDILGREGDVDVLIGHGCLLIGWSDVWAAQGVVRVKSYQTAIAMGFSF